MTTQPKVICEARLCAHFAGYLGPEEDTVPFCAAYPTGIPDDILIGADLHNQARGDEYKGRVYDGPAATVVQTVKHLGGNKPEVT